MDPEYGLDAIKGRAPGTGVLMSFEKSFEFAKVKPRYMTAYMAEFSKPRYGVDVLKVEVLVNMKFVAGTHALGGQAAYMRKEALEFFRSAASVATASDPVELPRKS